MMAHKSNASVTVWLPAHPDSLWKYCSGVLLLDFVFVILGLYYFHIAGLPVRTAHKPNIIVCTIWSHDVPSFFPGWSAEHTTERWWTCNEGHNGYTCPRVHVLEKSGKIWLQISNACEGAHEKGHIFGSLAQNIIFHLDVNAIENLAAELQQCKFLTKKSFWYSWHSFYIDISYFWAALKEKKKQRNKWFWVK